MSDLPRAALSTMWAVQPRFDPEIATFLTAAAEAGFAGIEVNHSMNPRQTTALIEAARATGLEARSLHAPAPWSLIDGHGPLHARENRTLNLASLDEAERRLAVAHHIHSIEVAARASMQAVVVHLGGIGVLDATLADEDWLRATFLERYTTPPASEAASPFAVRPELGEGPRADANAHPTPSDAARTSEAWLAHIDAAHRARAAITAPWFEAARRSLAELAPRAAEAGLTIGLETRLRYHEFPLPQEAADLLAEHPPEVAGYWHDVGHAEVLSRIGLVPLDAWRTLLASRLVGAHIHDVAGLTDHRAPGNVATTGHRGAGVDFAAIASQLPPTALRTFEVDQREPPAALTGGLLLARNAGLVG